MTGYSSGPSWPDKKQGPQLLLSTTIAVEFSQLLQQPVRRKKQTSPRSALMSFVHFMQVPLQDAAQL